VKPPDRRSRSSRRRAPGLEPLESRRLLAYAAPGPTFALAPGAAYDAAADARGRVTVVWEQGGGGGAGRQVLGRRFDALGNPLGEPFAIDPGDAGDQADPQVLVDEAGGAVVVWWSAGRLESRRYDADGAAIGGVRALDGTDGFGEGFDLFGLTSDGFIVYADGFRLLWYGPDGTLRNAADVSAATAEGGWTVRESDAPSRALLRDDGSVALTWSAYRAYEEGGATAYDAQVWQMYVTARGTPAAGFLVTDLTAEPDLDVVSRLDPRYLVTSRTTLVAWRDDDSFNARPYDAIERSDVAHFGGEAVGVVAGMVAVQYADAAGTSLQTYYEMIVIGGGSHTVPPGYIWTPTVPAVATPEVSAAEAASVRFLPTAGLDFWLLREPAAGGVAAQRVADSAAAAGFAGAGRDVGEADGVAVATVVRSGDVSQPASFPYATADGTAVAGLDYAATSGVLNFAAGQVEATISVPILDAGAALDRDFHIVLTAPGSDDPGPASQDVRIRVGARGPSRALSFFDYDAAGAWAWGESDGWIRVSEYDPDRILADSARSAFLSFGAGGLWSWDADAGWAKLNDLGPEAMAYGAGGVLFLDYGAAGLWSWSRPAGWAKLNDVDPARMVADDRAVYVQFTRGGVWSWDPAAGYRPISDLSPQQMAAYAGEVFLDYGPAGLWRWRLDGEWLKLQDGDAQAIVAGPSGLYADFGAAGVWRRDAAGAGSWLSDHDASTMAVGPRGVFLGFGPGGLWLWSPVGGWAKLADAAPDAVVAGAGAADLDALLVGPDGIARWTTSSRRTKLNEVVPRAVARA